MYRLEKANALIELKRYDEAIKVLMGCLASDPNDANVHLAIFRAHSALGNLDAAVQHAQTAVGIAPNDVRGHQALTWCAHAQKRINAAERYLQQCFELEAVDVLNWVLAAQIESIKGEFDSAINACNKGLALDPTKLELLAVKAHAQLSLGRFSQCKSTTTTMLELAPEDENAWKLMGIVKLLGTDPNSAIETARESMRLNPLDPHSRQLFRRAIESRDPVVSGLLRAGKLMVENRERLSLLICFGILAAAFLGFWVAYRLQDERTYPLSLMLFYSLITVPSSAINVLAYGRMQFKGFGDLYTRPEKIANIAKIVMLLVMLVCLALAIFLSSLLFLKATTVCLFFVHLFNMALSRRHTDIAGINRTILLCYFVLTTLLSLAVFIPLNWEVTGEKLAAILTFVSFVNLLVFFPIVRVLRRARFS